jgi:hypothetical protein
MQTPRSYLIAILFSAISLCFNDRVAAASVETEEVDISCDVAQKYSDTSACASVLRAWRLYRSASSAADHEAVAEMLKDARAAAARNATNNTSAIDTAWLSARELTQVNEAWQKWFVVIAKLPESYQAMLTTDNWRTLLALAHENPLDAELARGANDGADDLRLLLAGWLSNNFQTLERVSPTHTETSTVAKINAYVGNHKKDFSTGETCGGAIYNGRHFQQAEARFKSTGVAIAAAYLSIELGACGECEGEFECGLSRSLWRLQEFLRKHPDTIYTREMLLRAEWAIRMNFDEREATADYLSADNYYLPQAAAKTLVRFEADLKAVEPAQLVPLKTLLGEIYAKLKQPSNAQRVSAWLTQYGFNDAAQKINAAISGVPPLALRLKRPTSHGPNIIALAWEPRPGFKNTPLRVWRSENPAFTLPESIGKVLAAGTTTAIDRTVKPDTCYWYRVSAEGDGAHSLTHAAFAQTSRARLRLTGLVFDTSAGQLLATGELSGRDRTSFILDVVPEGEPRVGKIYNDERVRTEVIEWPTWWVDRDAGRIIELKEAPNAIAAFKELAPGVLSHEKHGLVIQNGKAARANDGKSFYVFEKEELVQRDLNGKRLATLYEEKHPFRSQANDFRAVYLFVRKNGEVCLVGTTYSAMSGRTFVLRKFTQNAFVDVALPNVVQYLTERAAWLYDAGADGVWVSGYGGSPALLGFDGRVMKRVRPDQKHQGLSKGTALARDPLSGTVFATNSQEVFSIDKQGNTSSLWQAQVNTYDDAARPSCPEAASKLAALRKEQAGRACVIRAMQLETSQAACYPNR